MTVSMGFYLSASLIYPRMQHVVAIAQKHTKVIPIKLTQSANKSVINIRVTMTVSICFNDLIKWGGGCPFSKFCCSVCIIIIFINAFCYNRQHTATLPFLVSRSVSRSLLSLGLFFAWIAFSFISPLPTFCSSFQRASLNRHLELA